MKYAAPPVWMTTGPATNTTRSPRAFGLRGSSAAMRDTLTSTRRSEETSFDMNAKSPRSRSRNSGVTRSPCRPQTTRSPTRTSRSFRHTAVPSGATTMTASMRCRDTGIQRPSTRTSVRMLVVE